MLLINECIANYTTAMNVVQQTPLERDPAETGGLAWPGLRPFRVAGMRDESENIRSFWLTPEDGRPLPGYKAGQYLAVQAPDSGERRAPIRTYSLSTAPGSTQFYRISVKREEGALNGTLPPGVFSNYLHDTVMLGSLLQIGAPRGAFVLDAAGKAPVCLISAGVGITPVMSMLERLVLSDDRRPVVFIHGARNGRLQAFRDPLRAMTAQRPWIRTHIRYSRPSRDDIAAKRFDSTGRVDLRLALSLGLPEDCCFFLCGPLGFLRDHYRGLRKMGVPAERILYENFGAGVDLALENAASAEAATPPPERRTLPQGVTVTFARSGVVIDWDDSAESILEAAEDAGLSPMYSCRSGVCQTCSCRLVEGEVDYFNDPAAPPPEGEVLICSSRPRGNLVIDL